MNNWRTQLAVVLLASVVLWGCGGENFSPPYTDRGSRIGPKEDLFEQSIENLNHLSELPPSDEILSRTIERLNQWVGDEPPVVPWEMDPKVAELPVELQRELISGLDRSRFEFGGDSIFRDGHFLREAIWMRDISNFVCRDTYDDLEKAKKLFDWTVRNIQLVDEKTGQDGKVRADTILYPWESLLLSYGGEAERNWIFTLLARQQRLDVVLLAIHHSWKKSPVRVWCALVSEGKLYPFDSQLGLPLPGPNPSAVATLSQLADDESLLRQLDLENAPYGVSSEDLKNVAVLIEASPGFLSRRMKLIEAKLAGKNKLVLTISPSKIESRTRACRHVRRRAMLWQWPYEIAGRRGGSQLAHERAVFLRTLPFLLPDRVREESRVANLRAAASKKSIPTVTRIRTQYPLWAARLRHFEGYFKTKRFDPTRKQDQALDVDDRKGAKTLYLEARGIRHKHAHEKIPAEFEPILTAIRQNATYWLGLLCYEEGRFDTAIDYFERTLDEWPGGPWTNGAHYNLARTFDERGDRDQAIEHYRADQSPGRAGSLIRAARLETQVTKPQNPEKPEKPDED